jgi:GNAT superfamily N-acetyltransferase
MIRELTPAELNSILSSIHREQHFLYYSYLKSRKHNAVHCGQFTDQGELLGVLAFLRGLPFYAFSVFPVEKSFCLRSVLSFMKKQLDLPNHAVGSVIVNEQVMEVLASQLKLVNSPKKLLLMKHIHKEALPPVDTSILHLGPTYFGLIESKMANLDTMAFSKEELQYPFYGVMEERELIAVGGYHIYSGDYVELGNIGTDARWRRQGYAKKVSAALTREGRRISSNVYLNVLEENAGAISLYQSIGYELMCKQYMVEFVIDS